MNLLYALSFIFWSFLGILNYTDEHKNFYRKQIEELLKKYDADQLLGTKSFTLEVNNNGFLRYKRILASNKTEYYSVKIEKVQKLNYYGNEKSGWLSVVCEPSSVIFQSYKDPSGDVDSMANEINFPLKGISEDELNSLHKSFDVLRENTKNNP
ncbi:hypothetical protein PBAC_08290 [Pedobacter glucosidilyticus]|uniref:Uncharacterized protein n=1 Tax=Pedobacter aquae TaxID=2605747 RepID=A0A5C0VLL8_9SPHI|nr:MULTISPECIES: hypothetical protein [Pedobacter]KHJ38965.1 hypothetical protein PBAC_08290 [Pedobacter glucosidilyticus]QEK51864.1 hypothetical protein FYC62_09560 [Pedobacter aquae]